MDKGREYMNFEQKKMRIKKEEHIAEFLSFGDWI